MDVLNRELQPEFNLIILATTKRRRGLALESIAKVCIDFKFKYFLKLLDKYSSIRWKW